MSLTLPAIPIMSLWLSRSDQRDWQPFSTPLPPLPRDYGALFLVRVRCQSCHHVVSSGHPVSTDEWNIKNYTQKGFLSSVAFRIKKVFNIHFLSRTSTLNLHNCSYLDTVLSCFGAGTLRVLPNPKQAKNLWDKKKNQNNKKSPDLFLNS